MRKFLLEIMPQHSICAEIGVWEGNFSESILHVVQPKLLYLVDPWIYRPDLSGAGYGKPYRNQQFLDDIYESVCQKFSRKKEVIILRMTSVEASDCFDDEFLDWVYIDGNHHYENVMQDLNHWLSKIKIGGFLTGDDYGLGGYWGDGVQKAVDEFLETHKDTVEKVMIKNRQFILRRTQ